MEKTKSLQLLKTLINIDSQTNNYIGVKEVQGLIADELLDLGFEINWIKSTQNPHQFLLHALKKSPQLEKSVVSFIGHADTALSLKSFFQLTEEKILGTGSADNKGGVVTGLIALKNFLSHHTSLPLDIHFLISPNEELGSTGFQSYLRDIGKISSVVLGLEPALQNGNLIKSRSGNRWYEIISQGIQAHSGRINIPKLNSLHETLLKAQYILDLTNNLENIRINFNSISTTSDLYNIVPEKTQLKLDVRFENNTDCQKAHDKIVSALSESHFFCPITFQKATSTFQLVDDCPAMEDKKYFAVFYSDIEALLKQCTKNTDLTLDHSWGAADISHMSCAHNLTLDGLGPVGAGMHREDEFIFVDSIYERAHLITKILDYIHTNKILVTPRRGNESDLRPELRNTKFFNTYESSSFSTFP